MKKVILSLFTAVYMLSASGLAMDIHYCMGEKVGFDFFHDPNAKCTKCGMTEKKGCCSDEQRFFKMALDHKATGSLECPLPGFKLLTSYEIINWGTAAIRLQTSDIPSHIPPDLSGFALCKHHCVFRL